MLKNNPRVDIKFGEQITIKASLIREHSSRKSSWQSRLFNKPKKVIMIGHRTLSNGDLDYDHEYGTTYTAKEWLNVVLVVENERNNPYYVAYEDIVKEREVDNV